MKTEQQIQDLKNLLSKDFKDFKDSLNQVKLTHNEFSIIYGSILGQGMILNWLLDDTDKNFIDYFDEKAQEELHQEFKI